MSCDTRWDGTDLPESQSAASTQAPISATSASARPASIPANTFAAITRGRTGATRNVWLIVPCAYSPAEATMPKISATSAETAADETRSR